MNLNEWVNTYINEISEDEKDPQEITVGNYQTKYFHVCPGASTLYKDIESKGVDMDIAERSARLQDALYFVEEHIQRDGYEPDKDYVMVANNIAKNIMKMAKMMGLEKEHDYIQGHVDTIEKVVKEKGLEESIMNLTEKNTPTDPSKWAYYKAQAKKKFDVYPSAYANGWAAKQYKAAGGGWKTENKESVNEAWKTKKVTKQMWAKMDDDKKIDALLSVVKDPDDYKKYFDKKWNELPSGFERDMYIFPAAYESVNEAKSMDMKKRLKVYDKLKKGDEITIKYGSSMSSGREGKFKVTKGKTVVGKQKVERITLQNVKNPKGVKFYLYQRNGNVTMAIGDMGATIEDMYESVNEGVMSELDILAKEAKDLKSFIKAAFKEFDNLPKNKETIKWLSDTYKESVSESTNEATPEEEDEFHRNLDKLVHKTFGHSSDEEKMNEASEPEIITQLRSIVSNKQNQKLKDPKSGKQMRVDLYSASAVTQVYDALKQQSNKDKFVGMGLVGMVNTAFKLINKNEINEAIEFSKQQLDTLRKNYSTINKINPSSPTYTKLIKFLNSLDNKALKQIANADVKFLSMLAKNRIKEGEEIEEYDVETLEELNDFHQFMKEYKSDINEGEYQGRDVELGKIMQGDVKKFKVYVKNDKGNVVKVNFGQKGMTIKKDNPGARKSFRARMNCDNPGPRWKARYWSCRKW
jgi:hypothetical protein